MNIATTAVVMLARQKLLLSLSEATKNISLVQQYTNITEARNKEKNLGFNPALTKIYTL